MPKKICTLRAPAREARAVDDVGDTTDDRPDQLWHVRGVVLHISVLDHGDLRVDMRNRGADGSALAAVFLPDEDHAVAAIPPPLNDLVRPIRGAVVNDDDLSLKPQHL